MVVRIRLQRHGIRNAPFYHIVAIADHKPVKARPIEKLGEYDPIPRPKKFVVPKLDADAPVLSSGLPQQQDTKKPEMEKRLEWDTERIKWWLGTGAQPSKTMAKILDKAGLIPPGVFFKGMYRPPTEEGLAHLEELRKMPSGTVRQNVAHLQRSLSKSNKEPHSQASKAEIEAKAATLGQQMVAQYKKVKAAGSSLEISDIIAADKAKYQDALKAHKDSKAKKVSTKAKKVSKPQKASKAKKAQRTKKKSQSSKKSSASPQKGNTAKPSPSSPAPPPSSSPPPTHSAAQTPS